MIPLFLGLQIANHLLLLIVFGVGLWFSEFRGGLAEGSDLYAFHIGLGIATGLFCVIAHLASYMYFMATHKWLWAASEKAALDLCRFVAPAKRHKSQALPAVMGAIILTMAAMFAGAGADPSAGVGWPRQAHLIAAIAAIAVNVVAACREFQLILRQQRLMDQVLVIFHIDPNTKPA